MIVPARGPRHRLAPRIQARPPVTWGSLWARERESPLHPRIVEADPLGRERFRVERPADPASTDGVPFSRRDVVRHVLVELPQLDVLASRVAIAEQEAL